MPAEVHITVPQAPPSLPGRPRSAAIEQRCTPAFNLGPDASLGRTMGVTCWAGCLGGCSQVQSREHYVSKGLFNGKSIKLSGLPWCKLEEKTIGLASAASKMLCKTHNERLSTLDEEAIRAFDALREIFSLQARQKKLKARNWKVRTWRLNGPLLERWFLKTLINLAQVQTQAIAWPNATEPRVPSREAVEACFGQRPILSPRGLYAAAAVGHRIDSRDYVSFSPIIDSLTQTLAGGAFEFRGFRFVLAWTDSDLRSFIRRLGESVAVFAGWQDSDLMHPLRGVNFTVRERRAQTLKVVWPAFKPEQP